MEPTKICTKCGKELPATGEYWYKKKNGKHGLQSYCKQCANTQFRKWHAANPERARELNRKWHAANPERARELNRKWKAANPERVREISRKWSAENPERVREINRKWRAENPEKARELYRKWKAANPEKVKSQRRKWKAANPEKYAARLLTKHGFLTPAEITPLDISEKLEQLQYHRQIKSLTKKLKENDKVNS